MTGYGPTGPSVTLELRPFHMSELPRGHRGPRQDSHCGHLIRLPKWTMQLTLCRLVMKSVTGTVH